MEVTLIVFATQKLYECQNTTLARYISVYTILIYLRNNYPFILVLKVGLVALNYNFANRSWIYKAYYR